MAHIKIIIHRVLRSLETKPRWGNCPIWRHWQVSACSCVEMLCNQWQHMYPNRRVVLNAKRHEKCAEYVHVVREAEYLVSGLLCCLWRQVMWVISKPNWQSSVRGNNFSYARLVLNNSVAVLSTIRFFCLLSFFLCFRFFLVSRWFSSRVRCASVCVIRDCACSVGQPVFVDCYCFSARAVFRFSLFRKEKRLVIVWAMLFC